MNINIDGIVAGIKYGESILNAVNRLGLDSDTLRMKPLAAQIGGEVFNLNYTPFRNVSIHLLRYGEEEGKRVYERTLQFVFIMSVRKLFPNAKVYVRYSMGEGLYITHRGRCCVHKSGVLRNNQPQHSSCSKKA